MYMKVKRIGDSWCIYELPFKPDNPARPAFVVASRRGCDGFNGCVVSSAGDGLRKALIRCGSQCPETYVGEAWVDYMDGRWVVELPCWLGDEPELLWLE